MSDKAVKTLDAVLTEYLGTFNEAEQIERFEKLANLAMGQVYAVNIIVDQRVKKVSVSANTNSYQEVYSILELARQEVMGQERDALLKAEETHD